MHPVRSRRRIGGALVLVVASVTFGWLAYRHVQRGLRASVLIAAVHAGDRKEVQRLLDNGFNPNSADLSGFKPLMRSVTVPPQQVSPEVVQLLLWYGADPNIRSERGDTVLDVALANKLPEPVIRVLVSNGGKRATELP